VKQLGGMPAPERNPEFPRESAKALTELAGDGRDLAPPLPRPAANIERPEVRLRRGIQSVEGATDRGPQHLAGPPITPDGAFAKPADAKTVHQVRRTLHRRLRRREAKGEPMVTRNLHIESPAVEVIDDSDDVPRQRDTSREVVSGRRLRHPDGRP